MIELLPTLSSAISIVSKLNEINESLKNAEFKDLIGDLKLQLADLKIGMADLIEENDSLKRELSSLKNADGDPCPRCNQRTYSVISSRKDQVFGDLGGIRRTYQCSQCDFTEEMLINPPI